MQTIPLPKYQVSVIKKLISEQPVGDHAVRILVLYGSLREGSFSRKLAEQSADVLRGFGAEVKVFNPNGLPVYNLSLVDSPKVQEFRYLALWSEGMLWCSPELHGNMSGVFKNQIDWIPLSVGSLRPTQGRTLALMQVNGGSQSFNVVNNIRMFTIPNQSPIPKASDQRGLLIESAYKDRVIDVLEELFKLTLLLRDQSDWLTQRYSENKPIYQAEAAIIEPVGSKKVACC